MILYLYILLSFLQIGFLAWGGETAMLSLLGHETVTLHGWFTTEELTDAMAVARVLPGGVAPDIAVLSGAVASAARYGFWGSLAAGCLALVSLALPAAAWTAIVARAEALKKYRALLDCILTLLRPLVPGLMVGAALLLMREGNFGDIEATPWTFAVSLFLFLSTLIGVRIYRIHAGFMLVLCGVAGWLLL